MYVSHRHHTERLNSEHVRNNLRRTLRRHNYLIVRSRWNISYDPKSTVVCPSQSTRKNSSTWLVVTNVYCRRERGKTIMIELFIKNSCHITISNIRNWGTKLYKIIIYVGLWRRVSTTKRTRSILRELVDQGYRYGFFFILHYIIMSFDKAATTAAISNHIR